MECLFFLISHTQKKRKEKKRETRLGYHEKKNIAENLSTIYSRLYISEKPHTHMQINLGEIIL